MKKVLFSAITASFLLASCGPDICDCVNAPKEMMKKIEEADGDKEKLKEIQEEFKGLKEKCDKLRDSASEEEVEKIQEEAKKCEEK